MADNPKQSGGCSGILGNLLAGALVSGGGAAGVKWLGPSFVPSLDANGWNVIAAIVFAAIGVSIYVLVRFGGQAYRAIRQCIGHATATGNKLTIVIATLKDDDGAYTRHVEESLRRQFGSGVEIIREANSIVLGEYGNRDEREQKAVTQGRAVLNATKGDVLIWGTAFPSRNVVELRFLAKEPSDGAIDAHRYALSEKLLLPDNFGSDLGAAVAAAAVSAAAPAFDDGHYVVDLLLPVVQRLQSLVSAPTTSLTGDARAQIFHSYAIASQTIGTQAGDAIYLSNAIAAYREALKERTRERVPLQWAMTQNNLGNTFATLGKRESGTTRLEEAVEAYREALKERTRERVPLEWATTQTDLGIALWVLGERESGTTRLVEAIAIFREALEERTRTRVPLDWAKTQHNLGNALRILGERESGTAKLEEAVIAHREALKERTRQRVPLDWAATQNNFGNVLLALGERESGTTRLEEAVIAYREALKERTREHVPLDWAMTQNNLGNALGALGERESGTARLKKAIAAYSKALEEWTQERVPLEWATTQFNLGIAFQGLGERENSASRLNEAVDAYREALKEWAREHVPYYWAMAQNNLGNALFRLGWRESGVERLEEAVTAYRKALEEWTRENAPQDWEMTTRNLARAEELLASRLSQESKPSSRFDMAPTGSVSHSASSPVSSSPVTVPFRFR